MASPPTSPPSSNTNVTIAATLDYNGTPIPINVSDLSNFVFSLTTTVDLGTLTDFVDWLHKQLGLPITGAQVQDLQQYIPIPILRTLFIEFLTAQIEITTLEINYKQKVYKFGATMDFSSGSPSTGIHLFGGLSLDSIGVLVSHSAGTGSPS